MGVNRPGSRSGVIRVEALRGGSSRRVGSGTGSRQTRTGVLRRPPEKGLPWVRHHMRNRWADLLEMSPFWVIAFVLVSTWSLLPRTAFLVPTVEEGDIASRTYIADRDLSVPNEVAAQVLQQRAEEAVLPVFDFDRSLGTERRRQLAALFEAGRAALSGPEDESARTPSKAQTQEELSLPDLMSWLEEASPFKVSSEGVELLRGFGFAQGLEDRLAGVLGRIYNQGMVSEKELLLQHRVRGITVQSLPSGAQRTELDLYKYLDYPDQVQEAIDRELLGWDGLTSSQRRKLAALILANCEPNLNYNSSATLELRQRAAADVGTVSHTIRRGEVIVRQGAKVDALAARSIDELAASKDVYRLALSGLGTVLLLLSAGLLVWLASHAEGRTDRSRRRQLSEGLLLLTVSLLGARFAYFVAGALSRAIERPPYNSLESYTYAIPLASLALICVLLYGRNMALVLSLAFSLLVGHIAGGEQIWEALFYSVASSLAAVFALDQHQFKQRSAMNRAGLVVGAVNIVSLLTLKALGGGTLGGLPQLGFDIFCGFAGGMLAAAVASFSVPVMESAFGITTSIKLIELANPNLPLLRRLAFEAPGTFQHSLAVANLAKSGVEAIEGDSVLVNTGALYHDIGKIYRPHYFIENQMAGVNPHDKIQPSMSALIITNHVKEGLELGHHANLPRPIMDAIEQHHGTQLIKFFYNKACERCDGETEVGEEEFRYPGPKPQSKEMGVLMLADAVEAASRTLVDPSRQKLRTVLRAVFDNCLQDSQLDHTDLTLGDLRKVEEAFLRVLTNIHHRRIDYPGFNFNRREGAEKDGSRAASGNSGGGGKGRSRRASRDDSGMIHRPGAEESTARPTESSDVESAEPEQRAS